MAVDPAGRAATMSRYGLRYLGALLLLGIGAIHLQQYFAVYYRVIPVIGPLFAANFAMAVVLAILLLVPLTKVPRFGPVLPALVAAGGIGFAAGVIIGAEISEEATLFGFHEHGYRLAITLSLALEAAAIVTLTAFLALHLAAGRPADGAGRRRSREPLEG